MHGERTGAAILAEGIETADHLDQALALGATLGQGWLFGRPSPLIDAPAPADPIAGAHDHSPVAVTPFALLDDRATRPGRKALLLDLTRHIEVQGMQLEPAPVVISSFQTADRFTPATQRRYRALAERCPLVAALAVGLHDVTALGVHGGAIGPGDPLAQEWTVSVVGPHYAAALIARDLGDDGPDHERRYAFVITHDRDLVVAAARSLMSRITAAG